MSDKSSAQTSKPLVDQFHDMLHRDHTGLVAGLHAVLGLVGGYQWARSSRGSYEWDDDRFHAEMGNMLDAVSKAANEALDRYKRGPLQCCVLERATPSETPVVHKPNCAVFAKLPMRIKPPKCNCGALKANASLPHLDTCNLKYGGSRCTCGLSEGKE